MAKGASKKKILVIEDNESLLEVLELLLTYHGFTVDTARTARIALSKAGASKYDVILMDKGLPDLGGIEICKKFRACGVSAPILMLTGDENVQAQRQALHAGADAYLQKPFSNVELLELLQDLIAGKL